eukprot:5676-Heterococcus_DN1.PRE.3
MQSQIHASGESRCRPLGQYIAILISLHESIIEKIQRTKMQLTLVLLVLLSLGLQAVRAFRDIGNTRGVQHASTLSVPAARQLATGGKNSTAKGAPRPLWQDIVLSDLNAFFDSAEVLQMYHLAATDTLFEQGGLDHALDFLLTAIAFQSMDRPEAQ